MVELSGCCDVWRCASVQFTVHVFPSFLPRAYVVCGGVFGVRVRTYIPRYLFASIPSEWLAPTTAGIKFGAEDNSALLLTTFAKLDSTLLGGKLTSYVD